MAGKISLTKSAAKHGDMIAEFIAEETNLDIVQLKTYLYNKLVSDRYLILLAMQNKEIIGLVECEVEEDNTLFLKKNIARLKSMYVVRDKRRTGIARQLLQTAKMWQKNNGAEVSFAYPDSENDALKLFLVSSGYQSCNGIYVCNIK